MTRDEILKMPAGRAMDSLIATLVLGWRIDDMTAHSPTGSANSRIHGRGDDWLEYYSTDPSAAWQVVEKVTSFQLEQPQVYESKEWSCMLSFEGTRSFEASADTAPLAICRAALLAVMSNE